MAVRFVPLVMSLLATSLAALPSSPLSLPPSSLPITSPRHPQPLAVSIVEKTRFCAFEKKTRYGQTDGRTDGQTDGQTLI